MKLDLQPTHDNDLVNVKYLKDNKLIGDGGVSNRIKSLENFVYGGYTRYVRLYPGKNSAGEGHIVEVKAIDVLGDNVALKKPISTSENFKLATRYGTKKMESINDGDLSTYNYTGVLNPSPETFITIDLMAWHKLESVILYQYFGDGRTYSDTKVQISQNNCDWHTIFDANVDGTYPETSAGKTITVPKDIYI